MTTYTFTTPVVAEGPSGAHRLFDFYKIDRGITIIRQNGVYSQQRYLVDGDLATYQEVYRGGYSHTVSEVTKAALIAGDVGVTEANFTAQ